MSDAEKLEWLLRLIVTSGGPERGEKEDESVFLMRTAVWMLNLKASADSGELYARIRKGTDIQTH